MRFILAILLIAIVSTIAIYFLPWWMVAVVGFIVAWAMALRTGHAFLVGFIGVFLSWLAIGLWRDVPNGHILSDRMAEVMLHTKSGIVYLLFAAFIGGLVAGLGAWSGAQLRRLAIPRSRH